jgi:hypothetical protein
MTEYFLVDERKFVLPLPAPVREFTVPSSGQFFITRHDYQRADMTFTGRYENGDTSYLLKNEMVPRSILTQFKKNPPECALPETVYLPGEKPNDFVPLSKKWQEFWFELLNLASQKTLARADLLFAWADLTKQGRAFTDFHSTAYGYTDYILGKNLFSTKGPIQHKSLSCGGNLVKRLGAHSSGKHIIEALNLSKDPPDPAVTIAKPWLVHWATQETVLRLADGTWKVVDFPQLRPYGTPFLVVSQTGSNLISPDMVQAIRNGAKFSPYNPI